MKKFGLLIYAQAVEIKSERVMHYSYQECIIKYREYIDTHFYGTNNRMSIIVLIILSEEILNEVYTLKEIIRQRDIH